MRPSTLWGVLSLAQCCNFFEGTLSLEANGSLSVSRLEYRQDANNPSLKTFVAGNLSRRSILFRKGRSTDQNEETYGGFQFVDSSEAATEAPDSTVKTNGVVGRFDGAPGGSDSGAIENNSWKRYYNGTVIHDVRISLVHPANMVEHSGGSAPDHEVIPNVTRDGRAPGFNHSLKNDDAGNSTMVPFEPTSKGNDSSALSGNRTHIPLMGTTTLTPGVPVNSSAVDAELASKDEHVSSVPQMSLDGKFPSVINLGISINAKGSCFSECLTKCSTAESNNSFTDPANCHLPACFPRLNDSTKGALQVGNSSFSDGANSSVDSVPILPLDQTEEVSNNTTRPDVKVAPDIGIVMLKTKEPNDPKLGFLLEDICLSESCVLKAADVIRRLGKSADPCDSFYKFACGGYFENEMLGGESSRSVFSDVSSDIIARMYSVLKSPPLGSDRLAVKLLKRFYGKCILTSPKELFMGALKELGGWPHPHSPTQRVPQHVWGGIAFNWTYGMFLEYNLVSINLTFTSEGDKWMLNVDYPWFVKVALNSDSVSILDDTERDIRILASALGIDNSTTNSVLLDLRIFMASAIKYAKATMTNAEQGFFSLKDLRAKFIHLAVLKELPSVLKTATVIEDSEMVYVNNLMYLQKVNELLRDSTVRTQAGHLVLSALRTLLVLIGTATDNVREKYCVKLTGKLFPHLFGHLYSSTFIDNSKVESAARIASHVRDSLLSLLDENVNTSTRGKISDRVSQLMFIWGHRNAITDDLNGIARGFEENPSFVGFVKTGIWNLKKVTYTYLHQRVNVTLASFIERYSEDDYGVNAFSYSKHVFIPYSALHENIFDPKVPPYVSYGGLGLIVGHELLHSIIAAGDISNSDAYQNMGKCMVNQFDTFAKRRSYARANGVLTKDENIADHGGFKVAYHAFVEWYNRSVKESQEKRLPGLHKFSGKQMFWLTAATNWCRKVSPDFTSTSVDKHAPPEYRVDGQFANLHEFAQDFNCPENSPMNPKEKCSLW